MLSPQDYDRHFLFQCTRQRAEKYDTQHTDGRGIVNFENSKAHKNISGTKQVAIKMEQQQTPKKCAKASVGYFFMQSHQPSLEATTQEQIGTGYESMKPNSKPTVYKELQNVSDGEEHPDEGVTIKKALLFVIDCSTTAT